MTRQSGTSEDCCLGHTQGRGIDSIMTSVNISDQACPMYIMVVSMQTPGLASMFVQFSEIGKHCNRFAKKNAIVQTTITPIIAHEIIKKGFVVKILVSKLDRFFLCKQI